MNLKTYQAKSMADALARVKRELGRDAVILHTRTLRRGGVLGIGARNIVEITATADEHVIAFRRATRESTATALQSAGDLGRRTVVTDRGPVETGGVAIRRGPAAVPRGAPAATPAAQREAAPVDRAAVAPVRPASASTGDAPMSDELRAEMHELRAMVRDLLRSVEHARHPGAPAELIDHYTHLIGCQVERELAIELLRGAVESLAGNGLDCWDESGRLRSDDPRVAARIDQELQKALVAMLPPAAPLELKKDGRPTVVALVGPTGVGKTTTIAKLAANMKLREHKKIGLITIDSYRIAAVEQLRTYAQILKVPLAPVLTPDEMRAAVADMRGVDLVLIDTAGRSQRDELRIAELREFLAAAEPDQVHLVLSTTSCEQTLREAVDRFAGVGARHVIFTKVDEAVGLGVMLNVLKSVNLRLSYVTNGQAVPDDIAIGSASRVARMILGERPRAAALHEPAVTE